MSHFGLEFGSEQISILIDNDTLHIKDLANSSNLASLKVKCSSSFIDHMQLSGSGDIFCPKLVNSTINISLNGSGDIVVSEMYVDRSVITLKGCGDISIRSGHCKHSDVTLKGSGDIKLLSIDSKEAKVLLEGSGDISIRVTEELFALLKGSGDIVVHGKPSINEHIVKGTGEISFI